MLNARNIKTCFLNFEYEEYEYAESRISSTKILFPHLWKIAINAIKLLINGLNYKLNVTYAV